MTTSTHRPRQPRATPRAPPASGPSCCAGSPSPSTGSTSSSSARSSRPCQGTGDLGFTDASLTMASTVGLVGVGIGAVDDRSADRPVRPPDRRLIASIAVFSVLTLAVAFAQNVTQFTVLRFLAGPRARRLPADRARVHDRARASGPRRLGGDPDDDRLPRRRRAHRAARAVADRRLRLGVDVRGRRRRRPARRCPLMWAKLPESRDLPARPSQAARTATARAAACAAVDVVKGRYLRVSIGLWVASFMGLLLVYGLNTWLPKIMGEAGYSIKAGTTLLLVLNVGAVIGLLVAGADLRLARQQADRAALVRPGRGLPGAAVDQDREHAARVRRGAAHRHLRVQRPGARLRLRRSPLPAGDPRHRPRHGRRRRPGRRDRRPVPRRRAGDRRHRLPLGLLRLRARRRARRARAGHRARPRARGCARLPGEPFFRSVED